MCVCVHSYKAGHMWVSSPPSHVLQPWYYPGNVPWTENPCSPLMSCQGICSQYGFDCQGNNQFDSPFCFSCLLNSPWTDNIRVCKGVLKNLKCYSYKKKNQTINYLLDLDLRHSWKNPQSWFDAAGRFAQLFCLVVVLHTESNPSSCVLQPGSTPGHP